MYVCYSLCNNDGCIVVQCSYGYDTYGNMLFWYVRMYDDYMVV